jgi:hypothetical protein
MEITAGFLAPLETHLSAKTLRRALLSMHLGSKLPKDLPSYSTPMRKMMRMS